MKRYLLFLTILLTTFFAKAQPFHCHTPAPDQQWVQRLHEARQHHTAYRGGTAFPFRSIALQMHIIVVDNTPTSSPALLEKMVEDVNAYFADVNIHFTVCGYNYVFLGPNLAGWGSGFAELMADNYYHDGYINVYTTDAIPFVGGVATSPTPGSPDMIFLTGSFFNPATSDQERAGLFAHELGHIFSLGHTFPNMTGPVATDELVNGSNCATAGDFICDTPADPGLTAVPGRVDVNCNYTDTIYTDANGDLFNPDTRNIMSFAPLSCYDHFSNEQLLQMRWCLDHIRYYLKSGSLNMVVLNTERRMCVYDPDITLTADPSGGTFSGNGVTGNVFSPAAAGGGHHLITYTLPGISDTVSSTDQYATYPDTSLLLTSCTQTFACGTTSDLSGISLYLNNPSAQQAVLYLYQGPVSGGTLLAADTVTISSDTLTRWFDLDFNTPVPVTAGNGYSFQVVFSVPTAVYGSFNNRYDGGQGDSLTDYAFVTWVHPYEANCGNNAHIAFQVIAPNKPGFEDYVPEVCQDAPAFTLQGRPTGGTMAIDFNPDSVFVPAALGLGIHTINYAVIDRFGCESDTMVLMTVVDDDVTISPLNSTYCPDDAAAGITGNPAGGTFYLDGIPYASSQLDFSQLSTGSHSLSYVYRSTLTYFNQMDVNTADSVATDFRPVSNNFPVWQSFKAGLDGYLNRIYFRWFSNDTTRALLRVFEGADTLGTLLYSDSVNIGGNGYYNTDVWLNRDQVWLNKDSMYLFCINPRIPGSTSNHGNIYLSTWDKYPDGSTNYSYVFFPFFERDLYFKTYIDPLYQCANDSVTTTFSVSQPFTVNLGNDTTLTTGQFLPLSAGSGAAAYSWSTGSTAPVILVNTSGTYSVVVTNADGCTSTDTIVVNFVVGMEDVGSGAFSVYPNPTKGDFIVENLSGRTIESIQLTDISGREIMVKQRPAQNTKVVFEAEALPSGVYYLHIRTETGVENVRILLE